MRNRVSRAFTLVEILIVVVILGILAAIVIPQFTSASEEAQVGNVQTQLQTIRSQIELFRVRNNARSPDLEDAADPFLELITPPVGQDPYLRNAPVNPRNRLDTVAPALDPIAQAAAADAVTAAVGWYYNATTGEIAAAGFDEVEGSATFNEWVPAP